MGRSSSKSSKQTNQQIMQVTFLQYILQLQTIYLIINLYKQAMRMIVSLIFMLTITAYANICGGNCPGGNCPSCPCGVTTIRINLDTYCTQYQWNQNCCKCISQRISGGSQNFYGYEGSLFYGGIMGVGQIEAINLCNFHPWSWMCYSWRDNSICAHRIYTRDGSWKYWKNDALACGCPIQSTSESGQENLSEVKE